MGTEGIHAEAAGEEGGLSASYKILTLCAQDIPKGDLLGFVYSNWMRSLRYSNDFFRLIDAKAYWPAYQRFITDLLAKPEAVIRLAALTEDPDVLLGFAVHRGNILDYVYVHKAQRKLGIGTYLVPQGIDTITHVTNVGMSIWGSKYKDWKFNPFA